MDAFYLIDDARSGVENMAIDQLMLEEAARRQAVFLRVYRWAEPTLSLGYFQRYEERLHHAPSQSLACVRRATGGGAIVHHFDWTYAIAVPQVLVRGQIGSSQILYDQVHQGVVAMLRGMGVQAALYQPDSGSDASTCGQQPGGGVGCGTAAQTEAIAQQNGTDRTGTAAPGCPFLCFQRRSRGDVVAEGWKLMGSAQRRIQGAVLQHGSLLLRTSPHAPTLPGIWEQICTPRKPVPGAKVSTIDMRRAKAVENRAQATSCVGEAEGKAPFNDRSDSVQQGTGQWPANELEAVFQTWYDEIGSELMHCIVRQLSATWPLQWQQNVQRIQPSIAIVQRLESDAWLRRRGNAMT